MDDGTKVWLERYERTQVYEEHTLAEAYDRENDIKFLGWHTRGRRCVK